MAEKSKIIDKAQKLLQKGYIDKAIAEYKRALEKDPKDATVRLRVGDLYVKIAKKDEAVKEYTEAAKIYSQKGFYLKAIAVYKQILKLDEKHMEISLKLADLYTKQGLRVDAIAALSTLLNFYEKKARIDETVDILKKMTSIDPQNIGIRLKLAEYYQKKGFQNDALTEYEAAFNGLMKEGKLEKAEKLYLGLYPYNRGEIIVIEGLAEVCRLKGDNNQLVRYYKELASLYAEKGEAEKMRDTYEKILSIAPDDRDALNVLGRRSEGKEEEIHRRPLRAWGEMIEVVEEEKRPEAKPEEAIEVKPVEEAPLIEMPKIEEVEPALKPPQAEEKKEEVPPIEAKEFIHIEEERPEEIAEELAPEHIEIAEEVIEEIKAPEEAEKPEEKQGREVLEKVSPEGAVAIGEVKVPPEEGYVDLSSVLGLEETLEFFTESWTPGEKGEEAFTEFKHGVERQLNKEDAETHHELGIAYMEMELYDDAMREFKIALKDPAFEFDCYTRLGSCLMAKGEYQNAINTFLKGIEVSGRTDDERKGLMYELGLAHEASGNSQDALEVFKAIFEMDRTFRKVSVKIKELTEQVRKTRKIPPSMDDMLEVELL